MYSDFKVIYFCCGFAKIVRANAKWVGRLLSIYSRSGTYFGAVIRTLQIMTGRKTRTSHNLSSFQLWIEDTDLLEESFKFVLMSNGLSVVGSWDLSLIWYDKHLIDFVFVWTRLLYNQDVFGFWSIFVFSSALVCFYSKSLS